MVFHDIVWTPKTKQEKSAASKWNSWQTAKMFTTVGAGRLKGQRCISIWPVNDGNALRWIPVNQIISIDGEPNV